MSQHVELNEEELAARDSKAALRAAEARAEHAEAELAKLKAASALHDAVGERTHGSQEAHAAVKGGRAQADPAAEAAQESGGKTAGVNHSAHGHGRAHHDSELEGDLFAEQSAGRAAEIGTDEPEEETPARRAQRVVGQTIEEEKHGSHARHGRVDPEHDPGNASEVKQPPSRSSAEGEPEMEGGEEELRKDSMMGHLLDSLEEGKDIGHYGRLVFAMVSRHFLPHEEVIGWLTKDSDFGEEEAELMLRQVEGRDYSPPRRAKILEYQREQEFPILPHPHDPDCGNLYRNLKFPDAVYKHIGHYQEQKMESDDE